MFNFKPVKWASSLLLSKFLNPYFKNFNQENIDVAFLEGQVCLKNLELRPDVLLQQGIDFEIVESRIGQVKLIIPWNNFKKQPIVAEIHDAKIVLTNKIDMLNINREQYKQQMEKIKQEVLRKFDESVQKEDGFDTGAQNSNFFLEFVSRIIEKFILRVIDIDIVFIYQINNYEIVKFGFGLQSLQIEQSRAKQQSDDIFKHISAQNIFLLFEVFDNVLPSQLQPDSFIREQSMSKLDENSTVHILKKLSLEIELTLSLRNSLEVSVKIVTSPLLVYFKQRQIRLLLRAMQDIANHRNDRPKELPKHGKNARNWWYYVIKRVIEKEYIRTKVKKQAISNYYQVSRYMNLYTKKMLKQFDPKDTHYMIEFESKNSVTQLLILRSMAIDKILEMRDDLRRNHPNEQQKQKFAQSWFQTFNKSFNMEHASNIRFSKTVINNNLSFLKEKESNTRIVVLLDIPQINVLIQENQILQHLKSLHQQVNIFKQELNQKKTLQQKVLDHIKNNFLQKLTKVTVRQNEMHKNEEWVLEELLKEKILINFQISNAKFELVKQGQFKQLIKTQISNLVLFDTNKLNINYNKIVELPEGIKLLMSSEQLERQKKILDLDPLEKTIQVHLDISSGPINITICKPLFERLISLQNLIFFERQAKKPNSSQEAQYYFDHFLIQTKRVQSNTNISFTVQRMNVYLPLQYKQQSEMFLIHLKQIKVFKREHNNNIVDVYQNNNQDGQVSQFMKDLQTKQTVDRVAQQPVQQYEDNSNEKPLFLSIDCLRLAFVESFDWEEKENIFLIQYKKLQGNQLQNGDPGIQTLMETLPIKIRMEQTQEVINVEAEQLKRKLKKKLYPKTSLINIQLPFLDIKMSIKHLYLLLQLGSIWGAKGYDFYDVMDRTKDPPSKHISVKVSQLLQPKLQSYIISCLTVQMEGVNFAFNVYTQEFLSKLSEKQMHLHENRLIQFYFLNLLYKKEVKFYETVQNLGIQELALQNINCHKYSLEQPLTQLVSKLLNITDYALRVQTSFGQELEEVMKSESEIKRPEEEQPIPKENSLENQSPALNQTEVIVEEFLSEPYIAEFWIGPNCQECFQKKQHRLLVNFQKPLNQNDLPDISFGQLDVYHQKSETKLELCSLNLIADPKIFSQLRLIIDLGTLSGELKQQKFIKWMRENGFWPDFNNVDTQTRSDSQNSQFITGDLIKSKSETNIIIQQVSLMLYYQDQVVYLMNMNNVHTTINSSTLFSKIHIKMDQVRLFDTAKISGFHSTILTDYNSQYDKQNKVFVELQICKNDDLIKIRKYKTYCGVRIDQAKIVFLKRHTNELQYYVRKVLLKSFFSALTKQLRDEILKNTQNLDMSFQQEAPNIAYPPEYGFKFSLVALDSIAIAYRNSLSEDAIYLRIGKAGYWFSGMWGSQEDELIKTGKFDFEIEKEIENEMEFREQFDSAPYSQDFQSFSIDRNCQEVEVDFRQYVKLWGLEVRCCEGEQELELFIKTPTNPFSLEVDINFEDKTFQGQAQKPMKITVKLPKAKIYAYDLDYCTICKFFMENLGEQAQTIFGPYVYDENNENVQL